MGNDRFQNGPKLDSVPVGTALRFIDKEFPRLVGKEAILIAKSSDGECLKARFRDDKELKTFYARRFEIINRYRRNLPDWF